MSTTVWITMGLIFVALLVFRKLVPSLANIVDRAVKTEDLGPVFEAIEKKPEASQPAAYNHAIRRLWDGYNRSLAVELIREMAKNYGTKPITQYWLKQLDQVEPKLARKKLGKKFYARYYIPELASQCGPAG